MMELDPAKLSFKDSNSPYATAVISGDLFLWNKFLKRYEQGTFCVTRTGYLMRFAASLDQIQKGNLEPKWSFNLTSTVLGDLTMAATEATFTLLADKYIHEAHAWSGPIKLVNGPIKLAKHTMSKLRSVKFGVPADQAQNWYDAIAAFAQKPREPLVSLRKLQHINTAFGQRIGGAPNRPAPGHPHDDVDDDDDDDDEEVEIVRSSASSYSGGPPPDSAWEKQLYDIAECSQENVRHTIADEQPSHIVHNPW
jgi:hypothetical protein